VPALRQHADLVAGGKLRQADRALRPLAPITFAGVRELRKRVDHSLLQALVRRRRRRSAAAGRWCPTEPGAARDGDEAHHANESAEESCQDHHEVGLDRGGCGGLRRGRRLGLEESEPACHLEAEEGW